MLCKLFLFPSDRGSDITLLEMTNQVALLKLLSYGLKVKNRFQNSKIITGRYPPIYGEMLLLDHPLLIKRNSFYMYRSYLFSLSPEKTKLEC